MYTNSTTCKKSKSIKKVLDETVFFRVCLCVCHWKVDPNKGPQVVVGRLHLFNLIQKFFVALVIYKIEIRYINYYHMQ